MNENDFRKEYERMQHQVRASSDLKERTLAAAERAADRFASSAQPVATASAKRPHRRAGSRSGGVAVARRWGLPAAACLVAAAIVAGGVPMVMGAMDADGHTAISLSDAQQASGFAVRAYASDGSAPLAPGEGGTVAFDRDLGYRFSGGDDYKVSGFFTGCLFHVEGEGISRVQANLTGGALYRVTFEDGPTDPDDPRMGELASWKPTARGTGEYYGGYDFVGSSMRNGESKLSLAKLMGSTIDVSASDDPGIADGTTSFGLWTNEGEPPENIMGDLQSPVIDLFEGQTLTVTVTFEDGRTSTQAIELHAANFETEMVDGTPRLTTRLAADDAEAPSAAKSLYGIVVKAGSGPFPFPLDDANDRADHRAPGRYLAGNRRGERRARRRDPARKRAHTVRRRSRVRLRIRKHRLLSPRLRKLATADRALGHELPFHLALRHSSGRKGARRLPLCRGRMAGQRALHGQMLARGVGLRLQRRRHAYERRLPLRVHDGDAAQP